ncbi:MAG: hypothetical protein ISS72_05675 [Candidatus Brocadiae bacterium]|nr:hypothetical protein [Candidatus Brocadiia bacterium]
MDKVFVTTALYCIALVLMVAGVVLPGRLLSLPPGTVFGQGLLALLSHLLLPLGLATLLSPFDRLAGRKTKRVFSRIALRTTAFTLTCTGMLVLVAEDRLGPFFAKIAHWKAMYKGGQRALAQQQAIVEALSTTGAMLACVVAIVIGLMLFVCSFEPWRRDADAYM